MGQFYETEQKLDRSKNYKILAIVPEGSDKETGKDNKDVKNMRIIPITYLSDSSVDLDETKNIKESLNDDAKKSSRRVPIILTNDSKNVSESLKKTAKKEKNANNPSQLLNQSDFKDQSDLEGQSDSGTLKITLKRVPAQTASKLDSKKGFGLKLGEKKSSSVP